MKIPAFLVVTAVIAVSTGSPARAGFFDQLKSTLTTTNASATNSLLSSATTAALSQEQMVGGLKEALGKGVERAVATLGCNNGFLTNLNVKIPMPEKLQKVETVLRAAGQTQMADDFVTSMNRAAEKAVPVAASVFGDAIKQMSIADAKSILAGPEDAATQFFRRTTQTNLQAKFYPLVQKATDQVGVTAQYKTMMAKFAAVDTVSSLFGSKSATKLSPGDIDAYVTDKAMDGLFKLVAAEEKNIRANPLARTSDLLQKVFGSAAKK
jgi:hypothetical protein